MRTELLLRCAKIADDRKRSAVIRFIALRMCAVEIDSVLSQRRDHVRLLRRAKKKLEAESSFRKWLAGQHQITIDWWRERVKELKAYQCNLGCALIDVGRELDRFMSFDQMCDLLEVGEDKRKEIRACEYTDKLDFMTIASVFGADHSNTYREDGFKSGPVFWAINEEIMRVMFDTPEGREATDEMWKKLFEPGELFHGMPTYYLQPDGTMLRKSADLTVHDVNGSRVVERPIGR